MCLQDRQGQSTGATLQTLLARTTEPKPVQVLPLPCMHMIFFNSALTSAASQTLSGLWHVKWRVKFSTTSCVHALHIWFTILSDCRNKKLCDAAFVTSSAVGMACGPLLALPLSYLPTTSLGPISIDPVTAGGWVMGLLWLTFLLLTLLIFEEPKSG